MDAENKVAEMIEDTNTVVEEPVKERKKPGPKPKTQQSAEPIIETPAVESDDNVVNAVTEDVPEIAEDVKPAVEPKPVELDVKSVKEKQAIAANSANLVYTYKRPTTIYRGPSDKFPIGYITHVRLTGNVKNGFAECISSIPCVGKVTGYVRIVPIIKKLLSLDA